MIRPCLESCGRIRGRLDSTSVLISRTNRLGRLSCTRCVLFAQLQRRKKQKPKPRKEVPSHQTRLRRLSTSSSDVCVGLWCDGQNPDDKPKAAHRRKGKGRRQRQKAKAEGKGRRAKTDRSRSNHPPRDGTFGMLRIGRLVVVPTGGCGRWKNHHHQTGRPRAKTGRAKPKPAEREPTGAGYGTFACSAVSVLASPPAPLAANVHPATTTRSQ